MQNLLYKLIVFTAVLFAAHTSYAQAPTEPAVKAGVIKLVKGIVQVENAQGTSALQSGDTVSSGDTLVTGADSAASLVLRDGSAVMLGPNSRLDLKNFAFDSTTQEGNLLVSLVRGTLRMITGLIGKNRPDSVEIRTPTTIIGVLGTDFIAHAEGEVKRCEGKMKP